MTGYLIKIDKNYFFTKNFVFGRFSILEKIPKFHFRKFICIQNYKKNEDQTGNELSCPCNSTNSNCFTIPMPPDEKLMTSRTCLDFTRSSATFPTLDCSVTPAKNFREQLNLISSYFDGTQIYGDSLEKSKTLRAFTGGLLKTSDGVLSNRPYLPKSSNEQCSQAKTTCFLAGETRTSENLGLTGVHTLFMREHNRIASALSLLNPTWSDETLYYETRRILIAVYQHIIYNEWIPATIGKAVADLRVQPINRYYFGYDSSVNFEIFLLDYFKYFI